MTFIPQNTILILCLLLGVHIAIRSEGCQDPNMINSEKSCRYAKGYIKVNGQERSLKRLGLNVITLDFVTGW